MICLNINAFFVTFHVLVIHLQKLEGFQIQKEHVLVWVYLQKTESTLASIRKNKITTGKQMV